MTILGVFVEPSLAFGLPGHMEWIVLLVLGLLIFGRRLPEVARSVGKSIVVFKKGLRDVKGEIDVSTEDHNRILPDHDAKPADPAASSKEVGAKPQESK